MKKLFATLALAFFTAACAQNGSMQGGMAEGMQCKCCQEMMKEGKECCCKGMMDSGMKMDMGKDGGKMQCPMCAKMKEEKMSKPASNPAPDEHEQHH
jgi:hypothetical protein